MEFIEFYSRQRLALDAYEELKEQSQPEKINDDAPKKRISLARFKRGMLHLADRVIAMRINARRRAAR